MTVLSTRIYLFQTKIDTQSVHDELIKGCILPLV